jgi:hypothetical protein
MSKFNRDMAVAVKSPVATEAAPTSRTFEGAAGYARDLKSELFLLAVSFMGEKSFYESKADRDRRFAEFAGEVAVADPAWMTAFVPWLRNGAGMRTASVVAGAEALRALQVAGKPGGRQIVAASLARAEEPGELLAYWMSRYGRKLPIALNRGISDALRTLYTEFAFLKYDSREAALRFGDVVELVNPRYHLKEYGTWRDALWRHAIEARHGRGNEVPESLPMIRANTALRKNAAADATALLDSEALWAAGLTWEAALSLAGSRVPKADLWAALIPVMGYMALLRNLRNFDEAGVPDEIAERVAAKLADPGEVAGSRQFPFRFLSAYRAVPSLRWAYPLDKALNASLSSVPALKGRTLVLVDRSPSMWDQKFSEHSDMPWADAAAVFGAALALRAERADLAEFWGNSRAITFRPGESVLKLTERFSFQPAPGGTDIPAAVRAHLNGHDRVVIVTDEQSQPGWLPSNMRYQGGSAPALIDDLIPKSTPLYMWNFGGYKHGAAPSGTGNRVTLGGLTDHAFRLIPMLEAGRDARWDDLFGAVAD